MEDYDTVDTMIEKLKVMSENGCGDYVITCNDEYALSRKDEAGIYNHRSRHIDFGGYNVYSPNH